MKLSNASSSMAILAGTLAILLISTVGGAPLDMDDDDQSENSIMEVMEDSGGPVWDGLNSAALRKLLLQFDTEERLNRVSRGWVPRSGWSRADGRQARPWRADKRQVRFRQCYFNPISCFRK